VTSGLEDQRDLADLQLPSADGQQLKEELESVHIDLAHQRQAAVQIQGHEAAHVIRQVVVAGGQAAASKGIGQARAIRAPIAEAADLRLIEKAAAGHQIELLLFEHPQGIQHGSGLVLSIAVHHDRPRVNRIDQAFFDGAGQP